MTMVHLFLALGLSALPAFLLLLYFYRKDRTRPEPLGLVWKSALYGFIAVAPAAALELGLGLFLDLRPGFLGNLTQAFLVAALVEESVKLWFLRRYLFRRAEFDERMDGVVYAICVSMGFAFVENFLYGYQDSRILLLRGLTAVPLHAVATGVMGYYLGLAKIDGYRDGNLKAAGAWKKGLAWAVGIHGAYDFCLLSGGVAVFLVFAVLVLGWAVLGRLVKRALALDAEDPLVRASQNPDASLP